MRAELLLKLSIIITLLHPLLAFGQGDSITMKLWDNGAPGFESRRNEPEKGDKYISDVHNPSITVYLPPKEKATGMAVVICPGGGHRMLVINSEGREPARYFNSLGIAAIVLKYRLARDTMSPYKITVHAPQDANRAMRLVRKNAAQWGIDANRIGIMGFSAGGEVVNMMAYAPGDGDLRATDAIKRLSAKPNFVILVYPGPLGVPKEVLPDAPPVFLVAANEDVCCSPPIIALLQAYRKAGASVEAHIYAKGNHAFNMGYRSPYQSLKAWPQRLTDWIVDNNYFKSATEVKK
ncbi:alpha/beta hydrolase [Mucilaginibacter paludis]|uniref:Endo-1,4-beta-xylanase n=1 Tax=Mucilaginibacter paludis DSM 18603 TaxID=714943 RepID=H1YEU0_9SPHI|nr:alpha/beta hydrolase [Mucilaginibacter paludis]EHQ24357.1 endo-1,4-beta-xylanase [Mucilaginibacter paludis DSM 18603]